MRLAGEAYDEFMQNKDNLNENNLEIELNNIAKYIPFIEAKEDME